MMPSVLLDRGGAKLFDAFLADRRFCTFFDDIDRFVQLLSGGPRAL